MIFAEATVGQAEESILHPTSAITGEISVPIEVIEASIVSPGCKYVPVVLPTPAAVPVEINSAGPGDASAAGADDGQELLGSGLGLGSGSG